MCVFDTKANPVLSDPYTVPTTITGALLGRVNAPYGISLQPQGRGSLLENTREIGKGSTPMTPLHGLQPTGDCAHIMRSGFTHHHSHRLRKGSRTSGLVLILPLLVSGILGGDERRD